MKEKTQAQEIEAKMQELRDNNDGEFPKYAWPGGYPLFYLLADNSTICPDCANGQNGSEATHLVKGEDGEETDKQWLIVACGVHYEGEPIICEHCNAEIASAYGDPDEDDNEPTEGDITTEDHKTFYQYGKVYLMVTGDGERWASELKAKMDSDQFWPSVYSISDHGNTCLLDLDKAISEEPDGQDICQLVDCDKASDERWVDQDGDNFCSLEHRIIANNEEPEIILPDSEGWGTLEIERQSAGNSDARHKLEMRLISCDREGRAKLEYRFTPSGADAPIFTGSDFGAPSIMEPLALESFATLLTFLTLRTGDTDKEYFDSYTEEQTDFSESYEAQALALWASEIVEQETLRRHNQD